MLSGFPWTVAEAVAWESPARFASTYCQPTDAYRPCWSTRERCECSDRHQQCDSFGVMSPAVGGSVISPDIRALGGAP